MKTTIDIPEDLMQDALRVSGARSKREVVVNALRDYVRRKRMAELARHAGTCDDLITAEELRQLRQGD
ncbi:MAG: type II toxin-antitoxin system VapB family antitoxin [Wenzhouxiangellaceae bacterium]